MGVADKGAGWPLLGNVKNVTNKLYYVGGGEAADIYQINTLLPGAPRTFTVEARYTF